MQLALAEIPLLRSVGAPRMSSPYIFTTCPPRESVGAAAYSGPHMSLGTPLMASLHGLPSYPPACLWMLQQVVLSTFPPRGSSAQDAVTGVFPVSRPPLMHSPPVSLQVFCEW